MMSGFSKDDLTKKLLDLKETASQQSIQTLSLWLMHHRRHYQEIVKIWYRELLHARNSRKLTFMYLANDVIQNGNKKGPEFKTEFGKVLKKSFGHMSSINCDSETKYRLRRVLNIWKEREVYNASQITEFRQALEMPSAKKIRPLNGTGGVLENNILLRPQTPANEPADPKELIIALQSLEYTASNDALVRERIGNLEPAIADTSLLYKLETKESVQKLIEQVDDGLELLGDYNGRLAKEMELRNRMATMLWDYTQTQKRLLAQGKLRLQEYTEKLKKLRATKEQAQDYLQRMPVTYPRIVW